jgi:hypothetical protein
MRDAITLWVILPIWAVCIVAGAAIWVVGIGQGLLSLFGIGGF